MMTNLVMAEELGREFESLVRLELGLLGLNMKIEFTSPNFQSKSPISQSAT